MNLHTEALSRKLLRIGPLSVFAVLSISLWAAAPASATFPGANGKIAFSSYNYEESDIYTINPDGSGRTRLTSGSFDSSPAWSPDGLQIAFTSRRDGNDEIYVMNADGTGITRVTNNPAYDDEPTWSPDGSRIAFVSGRDEPRPFSCRKCNAEIYSVNIDGSNETRLTSNRTLDGSPAWSPDGTKIAFWRDLIEPPITADDPGAFDFEILTMNADGSGEKVLTSEPETGSGYAPNWSPDGTRIVFIGMWESEWVGKLYTMNADGSAKAGFTVPGGIGTPVWSPDATKFALSRAVHVAGGFFNSQVFTMNPDGSGFANVSNDEATEGKPD